MLRWIPAISWPQIFFTIFWAFAVKLLIRCVLWHLHESILQEMFMNWIRKMCLRITLVKLLPSIGVFFVCFFPAGVTLLEIWKKFEESPCHLCWQKCYDCDTILLGKAHRLPFNPSPPGQNGRLLQTIFSDAFNFCILIKISLKFFPIDDNPALVQIMAWRRIGDAE